MTPLTPQLVPADLKFDPTANPPCFSQPDDATATIQKGVRVRIKIVGTRIDATEIFAIGPSRFARAS